MIGALWPVVPTVFVPRIASGTMTGFGSKPEKLAPGISRPQYVRMCCKTRSFLAPGSGFDSCRPFVRCRDRLRMGVHNSSPNDSARAIHHTHHRPFKTNVQSCKYRHRCSPSFAGNHRRKGSPSRRRAATSCMGCIKHFNAGKTPIVSQFEQALKSTRKEGR
jgi:hypothetical protein